MTTTRETITCSWCEETRPYADSLYLGDEAQHVCRACINKVEEEAREARDAYYRSDEAARDFWDGVPVDVDGSPLF